MAVTYNVMPNPKFFAVDVNGAPYAGGKLYAWAAGGLSVPQDTYADSIGTANANPVTLDASGRATVYLAPKAYAFELRDADGVQVWTVDPVFGFALTSDYGLCGGRLTLSSGIPVTTSDVTAATTLYFTPYHGSQVALFDGTSVWAAFSFTELSIAVPNTTVQMYDVFISQTAGVCALNLVAWTNDSTRATAIVLQNGVYVKSGATTNRYLGSFRTTASLGQTEDSKANRLVWNYIQRVPRQLSVFETTNSWNYTTATWRQANGAAANQFGIVVGVAEGPIRITLLVGFSHSAGGVRAIVAIGEDSTSATPSVTKGSWGSIAPSGTLYQQIMATFMTIPAVGYHFYAWLERAQASGTMTWYGDNNLSDEGPNSGMTGWIDG